MHHISDESFNTLIRILEGFMVLSIKFKTTLKTMLYETSYPKGKIILNFGQTQEIVWFMLFGLAREIKEDEKTLKEKTSWFWPVLSFIYTDPGFFSQEASERAIEILDDSNVVFISYKDLKILKDSYAETEIITEKVRSHYAKLRLHHADEVKNLSTDEKYLNNEIILKTLFTETKLKFIAEYMGMASDTLGKLRKKYYRRK